MATARARSVTAVLGAKGASPTTAMGPTTYGCLLRLRITRHPGVGRSTGYGLGKHLREFLRLPDAVGFDAGTVGPTLEDRDTSAVRAEDTTGDRCRQRGPKVNDEWGDGFGREVATLFTDCRDIRQISRHARQGCRGDRVDTDAIPGELHGSDNAERGDPGLCCAVVALSDVAEEPGCA